MKGPLSIDATLEKLKFTRRIWQSPKLNHCLVKSVPEHNRRLGRATRLIPIHRHALRTPAQFPLCGRTDRPASGHATSSAALLQGQQLLGSEGFIVDLAGGFDQILKVCTCEEVSEIDEFAVVLVFDVDDTPFVLSAANLLAIHNDRFLAAHDRERNDVLDGCVGGSLLVIQFLVVVGVHLEVVEGKFLLDTLLERPAFLEGKRVGLCDDGHNIDHIGEFLEHHNVDGFEGVTRWLNEEQAAMDTGILDVPFSLRSQFFSEVGRVLVFDVFHDRVPTRAT